ncbi:MAG TPA: adenylyltransferase/cytidyltransferase family protein [Bacteroidia bacterium]|jgi:glycerol-3-phosphate cytidylyltransferase|nr:adenylyltransferase/cytidyltransferase family protein [Bacteroidia bacterium]
MKTGFACGVFDLFHAGHVLMLQECRANCDYLIVAVNTAENFDSKINPGKNKPIYSLRERMLILSSCKYVDEVLSYSSEEELYKILVDKKIDIRFLGDDYKGKPITGSDLPIAIYYTDRSHGLSTSAYLKKIRLNN